MKNEIQKLISEAKDRKKSHNENCKNTETRETKYYWLGRETECDFFIMKLESLLNEQPEAITEDSHLRKHDVGRSAAKNDISTKGNDLSESSSETQAVGQNEQMQKDCEHEWVTAPGLGEYCRKCEYGLDML